MMQGDAEVYKPKVKVLNPKKLYSVLLIFNIEWDVW